MNSHCWAQIGNEYISGFEKIVDAYGQIAQNLLRLERLSSTFLEHEEVQILVSEVLTDLLNFHLHAYKFLRRGGKLGSPIPGKPI